MSELVETREQLQHLVRDRALAGKTYRNLRVDDFTLEGVDLGGAIFEQSALHAWSVQDSDVIDARFRQVDLRGSSLRGGVIVSTEFADSDLTEVTFDDAIME